MYVGSDFQQSDTEEDEVYAFDYVNDLETGETITAAAFEITMATGGGEDPDPQSHAIGDAVIDATICSQRIAGLLPGKKYVIRCLATTSLNNVRSLYAHVKTKEPA